MKKGRFPFFLWVIMAFSVHSSFAQTYQPFPEQTAKWEIIRCWYLYDFGWYDKYTIFMDGTDTLYQGEDFKNLFIRRQHLPDTEFDTIFPTEFFGGIREMDKKIYLYQKWASTDTTAQLVYDFTHTNIGDTIYTNVLSGNPNLFGHVVVDTDSVLVGTNYHKRMLLEDPSNPLNTEYWIEGIGSSWGVPFATFWSVTDNSYDLSCFNKNGSFHYENPDPTFLYCLPPFAEISCDPVMTTVSEQRGLPSVRLFPNPASDFVAIEIDPSLTSDLLLTIYDLRGRPIWTQWLNRPSIRIETGNWNNGIYLIRLQAKGEIKSEKLIISR